MVVLHVHILTFLEESTVSDWSLRLTNEEHFIHICVWLCHVLKVSQGSWRRAANSVLKAENKTYECPYWVWKTATMHIIMRLCSIHQENSHFWVFLNHKRNLAWESCLDKYNGFPQWVSHRISESKVSILATTWSSSLWIFSY